MTTGKLVFGHSGHNGLTPCIYRDNGSYEGTIPELNIRKVIEVEVFAHLDSERVQKVLCGDAPRYGGRWGGGMSALFPITNPEAIEMLRAENAAARAEAERKRAEADKEEERHYEVLRRSGLCPKCGTWCYGDCSL